MRVIESPAPSPDFAAILGSLLFAVVSLRLCRKVRSWLPPREYLDVCTVVVFAREPVARRSPAFVTKAMFHPCRNGWSDSRTEQNQVL